MAGLEYSCGQCGKSFSRKDNLKRHTNTGHSPPTEAQKEAVGSPLRRELLMREDVYTRLKAFSVEIGKPDLNYCLNLLLNIRDRVVEYHLKLDESRVHV